MRPLKLLFSMFLKPGVNYSTSTPKRMPTIPPVRLNGRQDSGLTLRLIRSLATLLNWAVLLRQVKASETETTLGVQFNSQQKEAINSLFSGSLVDIDALAVAVLTYSSLNEKVSRLLKSLLSKSWFPSSDRGFWLLQFGGWAGYALVNYIGSLMHEMRDIYGVVLVLGAYSGFHFTLPLRYFYQRVWEWHPLLLNVCCYSCKLHYCVFVGRGR